jgi:Ca-activated chloride channel family protein
MTFGAMAPWQAWGLVAAAAAIAAGLFLIKLRPPRIVVPSLVLWQRVLDASPDLTRWERIRRAVSLLATIGLAILLAMAITRPSRSAGARSPGHGRVLIVLDSSWSMLARTRTGETRWDRALAEARRVAASSDEAAIATTADGLVEGPTDDAVLLDAALRRLTPSGEDDTAWPVISGADAIHFVTDGAVARPLDRRVIVHSVFEPASNVAVTAFDVRPGVLAAERGKPLILAEAYVEVANFAARPQKVRVSLTRGNTALAANEIQMGPGEAYRETVSVAGRGESVLHVHVEADDNALAIDDDAYAWVDRARPMSVMVVGTQTEWVRRLLTGNPDVRVADAAPEAYRAAGQDLTIFDRWAPSQPPREPALYFAPPGSSGWLGATRDESKPLWEAAGDHPVVRGVDPATLRIDRARSYSSPDLLAVARSRQGTPIVYVQETAARRAVVVTFSAADSNLATAPGFPILVANALDWLMHPAMAEGARRPGLASFTTAVARVVAPDGSTLPFVRADGLAYAMLRTPGLYAAEGGGARTMIAVNAGDPQRSNVSRTSAKTTSNVGEGGLERPWWIACAMAAFLLALAEWWTWQRRITV